MKTLVKLSAVLTEAELPAHHRALYAIHHEISPGVFIHVGLGQAGLQIVHGERAVHLPLDELVKLARHHEPHIGAAPATPVEPVLKAPSAKPIGNRQS